MAVREPTAASQIWPHLKTGELEKQPVRNQSVADAMWPKLSREVKAQEVDQRTWEAICKRNRDGLLRGLKELRLARERGS
jgi:hypothetical protein